MRPPAGGRRPAFMRVEVAPMETERKRGVLIRGAAGELWFLVEDGEEIQRVRNPDLQKALTEYTGKFADRSMLEELPGDLIDALADDLKIPLIGAWCVLDSNFRK